MLPLCDHGLLRQKVNVRTTTTTTTTTTTCTNHTASRVISTCIWIPNEYARVSHTGPASTCLVPSCTCPWSVFVAAHVHPRNLHTEISTSSRTRLMSHVAHEKHAHTRTVHLRTALKTHLLDSFHFLSFVKFVRTELQTSPSSTSRETLCGVATANQQPPSAKTSTSSGTSEFQPTEGVVAVRVRVAYDTGACAFCRSCRPAFMEQAFIGT